MIRRRGAGVLLAVVMVAPAGVASALVPVASAQVNRVAAAQVATPAAPVTVPRRTSERTDLALRGASAAGVAVAQATDRLLLGSEGLLRHRGTVGPIRREGEPADHLSGAVGGTFAWVEPVGDDFTLHRIDLATGNDDPVVTPHEPHAFTGDGWLTVTGGELVRTLAAGGSATLLPGVASLTAVAADATGALVAYLTEVDGAQQPRLALVTFATSAQPVVVEQLDPGSLAPGTGAQRVALSAATIAWVTSSPNGSRQDVHHRVRAGGAVTVVRADGLGGFAAFAAADGRIGWLKGNGLTVLEGAVQRRVKARGQQEGLYGVGDALLTAVSGRLAVAGVYQVRGAGAVRIATVPPVPTQFRAMALTGDRIYYADDARTAPSYSSVWYRTIHGGDSPGATPRLSPPTLLRQRAGRDQGISFAAARGTVGRPWSSGAITGESPANGTLFLDRGGVVHASAARPVSDGVAKASGPYVLVQHSVFHVDGRLVRDVGYASTGVDLFGRLVVYGRRDGGVWVFDAGRSPSATNPRLVADACAGDCRPLVAVWGDTVAWSGEGGGEITVRTLGTGASREVPSAGPVERVRLSAGVLHWATFGAGDDIDHHVLDLASPGSTAVPLTGLIDPVVDGHRVAGFSGAARDLVVRPLPFGGGRYAPRLAGAAGTASFGADGDGRADRWRPAFDATKPLRDVRLRIYQGKTLIRTLRGSAPDGSIRDLVWDGRAASGRPVAPGTYRWRLTATARDGEGALAAADGRGGITGTVAVSRRR